MSAGPLSSLRTTMGHLMDSEFLHRPADVAGDVGERHVSVRPKRHGFPIGRSGQEIAELSGLPAVRRSQYDRDDAGLSLLVPLQGPRHFDAISRVTEIL